MSWRLDFRGEATPDNAQEREDRLGVPLRQSQRRDFGGTVGTACGQDREDLMRRGKRTRPGATSAWAPATDLAVGLTERSHRRAAYDEFIDRILGRGHNLDDQ